MLFRLMLAALALSILAPESEAGPFRRRSQPIYYQAPNYYTPASDPPASEYVSSYTPPAATGDSATTSSDPNAAEGDGLEEVNAQRAARGLRPFIRDEGLTQAARACAAHRAEYGIFGHSSNDFAFVPAGTWASSAGCAAYPASYGWLSCCVYDNYTYGGAAWVTGRDGRRFMHLFVR